MGHEGHEHDGEGGHGPDHHHGHPHAEAAAPPHRDLAHDTPREHRAAAPGIVRTFVVTASDTRTEADDTSGRFLKEALVALGHEVLGQEIVKDEPLLVARAIGRGRAAGADAVIVTGGTGITRRDSTFEAVRGLLHKELPGFGELFRMLSFEEIGSAAMLSRATAGITSDGLVIFAIPGSTGACRTAMSRLIGPELGHVVREAKRG